MWHERSSGHEGQLGDPASPDGSVGPKTAGTKRPIRVLRRDYRTRCDDSVSKKSPLFKGLAWNLTLPMFVSGTYPVGAHQDVRVGIFQISKDTDATEAEIAVSVPGSVFYTIFLSNISGGNILRLIRRAKFLTIL